jgi:hypothetical protein
MSRVLLFVSDQSAQRRSTDKLQELSLLRRLVTEASAAEMRCCKFAPVPSVVLLTFFSDGEKSREFVQPSSRINAHVNEYLIICLQIHLTKQFAVTGNHRSTMLHLAPLYVLRFLASSPSTLTLLLPSTSEYVIGARFGRPFY